MPLLGIARVQSDSAESIMPVEAESAEEIGVDRPSGEQHSGFYGRNGNQRSVFPSSLVHHGSRQSRFHELVGQLVEEYDHLLAYGSPSGLKGSVSFQVAEGSGHLDFVGTRGSLQSMPGSSYFGSLTSLLSTKSTQEFGALHRHSADEACSHSLTMAKSTTDVELAGVPKKRRAMIWERWAALAKQLTMSDTFVLRRCWVQGSAERESTVSESDQLEPQDGRRSIVSRFLPMVLLPPPAVTIADPILTVWKRRKHFGRRGSQVLSRQWRNPTERNQRRKQWMLHPDSSYRAYWACIGVSLLLVDMIYLTMSAFEVEPPYGYSICDACYWFMDILLSFRTGIFVHGLVNFSQKQIARRYLRGWFSFDLILFLYQTCMMSMPDLNNVKYLRLIRFLRMARVAKLDLMYGQFLKLSQSVVATMLVKLVFLTLALMMWVHISGCAWYGISINASRETGWVKHLEELREAKLDMSELYLLSLHWAASQLQGSIDYTAVSVQERLFTVAHTLLSVVASALLIGKLMTVLQELEHVQRSRKDLMESAFRFMRQNRIPTDLCIAVQRYLRRRATQDLRFQNVGSEERLFSTLPRRLRRALLEESRWLAVGKVLVFEAMHEVNIKFANRVCCDLMQNEIVMPDDSVFHSGDVAHTVFFTTHGTGIYTPRNSTHEALLGGLTFGSAVARPANNTGMLNKRVLAGTLLCEAVLWVRWAHQGDFEVDSENQVFLLRLSCDEFLEQVARFGDVSMAFGPHATRVAEYLNRAKIDDMWCSEYCFKHLTPWNETARVSAREPSTEAVNAADAGNAPTEIDQSQGFARSQTLNSEVGEPEAFRPTRLGSSNHNHPAPVPQAPDEPANDLSNDFFNETSNAPTKENSDPTGEDSKFAKENSDDHALGSGDVDLVTTHL